jgi:hypothetical protein
MSSLLDHSGEWKRYIGEEEEEKVVEEEEEEEEGG